MGFVVAFIALGLWEVVKLCRADLALDKQERQHRKNNA